MMTLARTETLEQRAAILRGLIGRNRLVTVLRVAVPIAGLAVFLVLAAQIYVGNLARQFGVSGITIDRNNLVVETPSYSSTNNDGTRYTMSATEAKAALGNPDAVALSLPSFSLLKPDGVTFLAKAEMGQYTMTSQQLVVPGTTTITGSDGTEGSMDEVNIDLPHRDMVANGEVHLTFAGGASIDASSMTYDSKMSLWTFAQATVTMPNTPTAGALP